MEGTAATVYLTGGRASRVRRRGRSTALRDRPMAVDPRALLPRDKRDLDRARALVALGYPAVAPVLPDLLEWLQDCNWPASGPIADFLESIPEQTAPLIWDVLSWEGPRLEVLVHWPAHQQDACSSRGTVPCRADAAGGAADTHRAGTERSGPGGATVAVAVRRWIAAAAMDRPGRRVLPVPKRSRRRAGR